MLTPQQIQTLTLQAKARGYDDATTQRFLQFADQQYTQAATPPPTPAPQPEQQKTDVGGFLKSVVKDPIKTLLVKPGTRIAQAGVGLYGELANRPDLVDRSLQDVTLKTPFGTYNVEGQKKGLAGVKQIAGDAAKSASYLYTPGEAAGALDETATAGGRILQGAKAGATGGALYSGGESAIQGNSVKQIGADTLKGGAAGAVIGAAVPATVEGVKAAANSPLLAPRIEKPSAFQNKLIERRTAELDKLDNYASVRKSVNNAQNKGFDVKKIVAETDLLHNSVDETGTIRTSGPDGAIQQVNDFLKPQESVVSKTLKKEGKKIPLKMVENKLKTAVNDSGLKGGAKIRALKSVEDDIAGYALEADKDGYIPLSTIHDAKVDKYANINYLNPESQRADKAIAKGLKELVEQHTKSVDVKNINKELSKYYALISYLEKLDGKKVEGGKLGKYFAQTLGGVVGSHFGPLGTIAGAEIAGKIKGYQMASKFGRKIGNDLTMSPQVADAIRKAGDTVIKLPGR